jgi:hypothetical protein
VIRAIHRHGVIPWRPTSTPALELTSGVESVEQRHRDVEHDDIRRDACTLGNQRAPIGDGSHHLELGFEEHLEGIEQERVIVGQQNTRPPHGILLVSAIRRRPSSLIRRTPILGGPPSSVADSWGRSLGLTAGANS